MKVLYLSQTDPLQTIEIDDLLDYFLKNGSPSALLKEIASILDAQGYYTGTWVFGSFAIIELNLPKNNILILSDGELNALYSYAVLGHEGISEEDLTTDACNARIKIGELVGSKRKPDEEKPFLKGLSKHNYPG